MRRGRVGWVRWRGVGDEWPRKLPDQIVCEARGSARGTFGASRIAPLSMGPAGAVFSSAGSRDYY